MEHYSENKEKDCKNIKYLCDNLKELGAKLNNLFISIDDLKQNFFSEEGKIIVKKKDTGNTEVSNFFDCKKKLEIIEQNLGKVIKQNINEKQSELLKEFKDKISSINKEILNLENKVNNNSENNNIDRLQNNIHEKFKKLDDKIQELSNHKHEIIANKQQEILNLLQKYILENENIRIEKEKNRAEKETLMKLLIEARELCRSISEKNIPCGLMVGEKPFKDLDPNSYERIQELIKKIDDSYTANSGETQKEAYNNHSSPESEKQIEGQKNNNERKYKITDKNIKKCEFGKEKREALNGIKEKELSAQQLEKFLKECKKCKFNNKDIENIKKYTEI